MGVKWIEKVKKTKGLTNYSLAKLLTKRGVDTAAQTINQLSYPDRDNKTYIRLCHCRDIAGVSWSEFGKWLDEEFLK